MKLKSETNEAISEVNYMEGGEKTDVVEMQLPLSREKLTNTGNPMPA